MTPDEAATLLGKCAGYDSRTIGRADALAWAEALDDVPLTTGLAAVGRWYREHRDRIMPSDVRALAADIARAQRKARDAAAVAELEAEPGRRDRSADVTALLARLRDSLPAVDPATFRRPEVLAWERQRGRDERAEPNPHYDPAAAARLAERETPDA